MFKQGYDVQKNEKEAVRLLRFAAEQGHADARCNLGSMFKHVLSHSSVHHGLPQT